MAGVYFSRGGRVYNAVHSLEAWSLPSCNITQAVVHCAFGLFTAFVWAVSMGFGLGMEETLNRLVLEAQLRLRARSEDGSSSDSSVNSSFQLGEGVMFLDQGLPPPRPGEAGGEDELVDAGDLLLFDRSEGSFTSCLTARTWCSFSDSMELSDCELRGDAFTVDEFFFEDLPPPGLGGEIQLPVDPILENAKDFVAGLPLLGGVENHMQTDPILENAETFVSGLLLDEKHMHVDITHLHNAMQGLQIEDVVHVETDVLDAMEELQIEDEVQVDTEIQNAMDQVLQIEDMVEVQTAGRRWPVLEPSNSIGVNQRENRGTWQAHIWLKDFNLDRPKHGMQLFVGSFGSKDDAKKAHDKVAIKLDVRLKKDGAPNSLNFPEEQYAGFTADLANWSRRDYLWKIRRDSETFSTGECSLKGVSKRKIRRLWKGQYTASISVTPKDSSTKTKKTSAKRKDSLMNKIAKEKKKKKSMTLGHFDTEEEAGREYDKALLFIQGVYSGCVTNFKPGSYMEAEVLEIGQKLTKWYPTVNFKEHETILDSLIH